MGLFTPKKKSIPEIQENEINQIENTQTNEFPTPQNKNINNSFENNQYNKQPNITENTLTNLPQQSQLEQKNTQQEIPLENIKNNPNEFNNTINKDQHNEPKKINKIPTITKELKYNENTKEQPFFIRIDKYNETKDNFKKINEKVILIEKILESLEKTKEQEEKEIEEWKQEITEIKSYLNKIDKEVFYKI